jgi:MFS family permease
MWFNALGGVTGRPVVVLVTIASTCGFLLFGYDNGVFSGLIVSPWFLKTFHNPKAGLLGTDSAMYNIGGVLGGIAAFFIGDKLGRRRTILSGIAVCTIGAIVQCTATNIAKLVSGRIVCGMDVSIMTSTVGIWQAEMVPTRSRGQYLCFQNVSGTVTGLFLAQWINFGFNAQTGRLAFTFPLAFQLVFLAISGSLILVLLESPRWLVKKCRRDEALAVLIQLQGETDSVLQLAHIIEADAVERQVEGNQYMQLFARGRTQNLRRLGLACGTMIMHQLGGYKLDHILSTHTAHQVYWCFTSNCTLGSWLVFCNLDHLRHHSGSHD